MENIMVPSEYRNAFEILGRGRNTAHTYNNLSLWPELVPHEPIDETTTEFWKLSDLFQTVDGINTAPYKSTITLDNIVREYTPAKLKSRNPERMSQMAARHFRVLKDQDFNAELTRFATWALFKEIGKSAPTIFHQEYCLAPQNAGMVAIYKNAKQTMRIDLRNTVKKYQKQLNGIMGKLHAQNTHYAELNREMIKWLFGNLGVADIQQEYKLPAGKPLADFMNANLLAAYATALKNIVDQWDFTTHTYEYGALRGMVYNAMIAARNDMQKKFGSPEKNFARNEQNQAVSVDEVEQWHKNREFEFARAHLNDHVR